MSMKMNSSTQSILRALISRSDEVSALNSGKFLTTRITNHICLLRQYGIQIDTQMVKANSGKWYGTYKLMRSSKNIAKAKKVLLNYEVNREN